MKKQELYIYSYIITFEEVGNKQNKIQFKGEMHETFENRVKRIESIIKKLGNSLSFATTALAQMGEQITLSTNYVYYSYELKPIYLLNMDVMVGYNPTLVSAINEMWANYDHRQAIIDLMGVYYYRDKDEVAGKFDLDIENLTYEEAIEDYGTEELLRFFFRNFDNADLKCFINFVRPKDLKIANWYELI